MEETIPADVRAGLAARDHKIKLLEPSATAAAKVNFAACDPRSDGAAIPQQRPTQ